MAEAQPVGAGLRPLTATLVARYAERCNAALVDGAHTVTSPLGAWMLLALVAPAATGAARARLEEVLGTDVDDAAARAAALLGGPHPAIAAAAAVWADTGRLVERVRAWADALPPVVEFGPVPGQAGADRWARDHTKGLIERFPVDLGPDTFLVVASALATRVRWNEVFERVPASRLGGPWADRVTTVLEAPTDHRVGVAVTEAAGEVAVHAAQSDDGLLVASVIAAPHVAPAAVLAAAHEVGQLVLLRRSTAQWRSLFELPLEPGHAWTLRESEAPGTDRTERCTAWMPAWRAEARHELLDRDLGFREGIAALMGLAEPAGADGVAEATQVAVAAFGAEGFEAAAITSMAIRGLPEAPKVVRVRHAEVRFDRAYAVVAFTAFGGKAVHADPAWGAMPVFSAWVAEPTEA